MYHVSVQQGLKSGMFLQCSVLGKAKARKKSAVLHSCGMLVSFQNKKGLLYYYQVILKNVSGFFFGWLLFTYIYVSFFYFSWLKF